MSKSLTNLFIVACLMMTLVPSFSVLVCQSSDVAASGGTCPSGWCSSTGNGASQSCSVTNNNGYVYCPSGVPCVQAVCASPPCNSLCSSASTCSSCTANSYCGWCTATNQCLFGGGFSLSGSSQVIVSGSNTNTCSGSAFLTSSASCPASAGTVCTVTRTATSPSICIAPTDCNYKCSAAYTLSITGSTAALTLPGSVSGCTCYSAAGTFSSGRLAFTFGDGTQVTGCYSNTQSQITTVVQGQSCVATYSASCTTGSITDGTSTCGAAAKSSASTATASLVTTAFVVAAAALV